jgi:hypothetical protein
MTDRFGRLRDDNARTTRARQWAGKRDGAITAEAGPAAYRAMHGERKRTLLAALFAARGQCSHYLAHRQIPQPLSRPNRGPALQEHKHRRDFDGVV